ncbi:T9SS type A sorting domain-containing protein [Flavobacterium hauense]
MKNFYMTLFALASMTGFAQHCNTIVINDTSEQNGIFISGAQGQKAAADIPIEASQQMTITHIKVTLSSKLIPEYIHFRFYDNLYNVPEDPEVAPGNIPGEILFDVTATTVGTSTEIAYDEMHDFYIRDINVELSEPIVLNGDLVEERFWMGVLSDARAWNCTAHYETGEGVIGESLAMGNDTSEWFQMINMEQLYELTAECSVLGAADFNLVALSVFPNPANDVLNIALPDGSEIAKIEIYTIAGQKIQETGNEAINVPGLAPGVYIIKAQTADNRAYNGKFMKN